MPLTKTPRIRPVVNTAVDITPHPLIGNGYAYSHDFREFAEYKRTGVGRCAMVADYIREGSWTAGRIGCCRRRRAEGGTYVLIKAAAPGQVVTRVGGRCGLRVTGVHVDNLELLTESGGGSGPAEQLTEV